MNRFLRTFLQTLLPLAVGAWAMGCSDSPKQYPHQTPTSAQIPAIPDEGALAAHEKPAESGPSGGAEPVVDQDARVRAESRAPIVYGSGAGGVSWETELKDAQGKLSKPEYGPDARGVSQYKSGMQVVWRTNEPRQPVQILLWTDYLGAFNVGGKFGEWKMGEDLSRFFQQDEKGERFIVELYNHLEKKDASYDCLKARVCRVLGWDNPNEDEITLYTPKLALLVAKDRRTLFLLRLDQQTARGKLHNDFDIVTGEFLIPAEQGGGKIALGQTWREVLAINEENARTEIRMNVMGKPYDGVYLELTKSDFSRGYKSEPLMDERLKAVIVHGAYQNNLRMNGQLIELKRKGPGLGLELALSGGAPVEGGTYARITEEIQPADQLGFLRAFMGLLKAESAKLGGEALARFSERTYSGFVINYDARAAKGRIISFGFSDRSKQFSFVSVSDALNPSDKVIIPALMKPYNAGEATFAGFKLKDRIRLKDIDLGRKEATVALPGDAGLERVAYVDSTTLEVSYDGAKREFQTQTAVSVGSLGVRLGLVPVSGADGEYEIASVGSEAAKVSNLCGIEGLDAVVGEEANALLARLRKAVADRKEKHKGFECRYFQVNDRRDTGRLAHLFFADQKLKLSFEERELVLISVYDRPSEARNGEVK